MDHPISHVLVPVDPDGDTNSAQFAAMRLAAGDGALVTLLYVHDRHAKLRSSVGIESIENLHQVMSASPQDLLVTPSYPDHKKNQSLQHLREMRERLGSLGFDESLIRTAFRCGDAAEETANFIEEAGVDVVLMQSQGSSSSPTLRRHARELQRNCPCQLQIVHPPQGTKRTTPKWTIGSAMSGYSFLPAFLLKFGRPRWQKVDRGSTQ